MTSLRFRLATSQDSRLYFEWANDPETRRQSFSSQEISWEEHTRWFTERLARANCRMWLLEDHEAPVGQIRFDWPGPVATLSFSVAPRERGRGLGRLLLTTGAKLLFSDVALVEKIEGLVKPHNVGSLSAFRAAGFSQSADRDGANCFFLSRASSEQNGAP